MQVKMRYKIIRKFDVDFWNLFIYKKKKKNRFFKYYKQMLINKFQFRVHNLYLTCFQRKIPGFFKMGFLGYGERALATVNPFLGNNDPNYYKLVLGRYIVPNGLLKRYFRKNVVRFKKLFFARQGFKRDLLLGRRSHFKLYRYIRRKPLVVKKNFFRKITLFYNDFDTTKLRRFGRLGRKGQSGGVNFFLFLLESRVDSIVLRLNIGTKFTLRHFIRAKCVLINGIPQSYPNYIVKKGSLITFKSSVKYLIFSAIRSNLKRRRFFLQPPYFFEINYRTLRILILPKLMDPSFVLYPFLKSNSGFLSGLHTVLWGW